MARSNVFNFLKSPKKEKKLVEDRLCRSRLYDFIWLNEGKTEQCATAMKAI